jgi:hypothetical protein
MKQNGIRPPRGKRRVPITTDSQHAHAVAPNMLDRPKQTFCFMLVFTRLPAYDYC